MNKSGVVLTEKMIKAAEYFVEKYTDLSYAIGQYLNSISTYKRGDDPGRRQLYGQLMRHFEGKNKELKEGSKKSELVTEEKFVPKLTRTHEISPRTYRPQESQMGFNFSRR